MGEARILCEEALSPLQSKTCSRDVMYSSCIACIVAATTCKVMPVTECSAAEHFYSC